MVISSLSVRRHVELSIRPMLAVSSQHLHLLNKLKQAEFNEKALANIFQATVVSLVSSYALRACMIS